MSWLGPVAFLVGALLVGIGLTIETSGTSLIIGIMLMAGGYVIMRKS